MIRKLKFFYIVYVGCRSESKEMMKQAYGLREKVIERIIQEENAKQPAVLPSVTSAKAKGSKKKK